MISNETCVTTGVLSDGVVTTWDFSFNIPDKASATLILQNTTTLAETIVDDSLFTIDPSDLDNDSGGTVTYPISGSPLAAGYKVFIARDYPYAQNTNLGSRYGAYLPEVLEKQLDRIVMDGQQNRRDINRSLKLAYGAPAISEGHFPKATPSGYFEDGGDADDIINAQANAAAAAAAEVAAAASAAAAAASAASVDVHYSPYGVVPQPSVYFDNTRFADQGAYAPKLTQNFYWGSNFGWYYTRFDDARLFAGDSQFGFQSFSSTVNGANTSQLTGGPYAAGATSIIGSGAMTGAAVGKTLTMILDQVSGGANEVHEARITAVAGTTLTFTPAIPASKSMTVGATSQLWRMVWSRVSTIQANVTIGTNVFSTKSPCGLAGAGEFVRVKYDDGTWFISTVASYTNTSITTVDNTTKAITAGTKLIYVGTLDVDPNVSLDRGSMPNVAGDIMPGLQWSGRSKANGIYRQFRIIPYVVDADLAGGTAEMDVQFQVTDQAGGNFVPTFSLKRGLIGTGATTDPGIGGANLTGLMVNAGSKLVFMKKGSLAAVNYGTVNAGTGTNATFGITGAVVGDDAVVTLGATHRAADGIIWTTWVNSTNNVTVRAYNPTGANIVVGSDTLVVTVRRLT